MTDVVSTRKRALTMLAFAAALLFAVGGLAACGDDDDPEEGETPAATEEPAGGVEEPADEGTGGDEAAGGGDDGAAGGDGDAQAGSQLFADNCETCHGPEGAGGAGPPLDGASDAQAVEEQIRNGGGGMPAFEGQLDDQQIADLVAYVTEDIAGGGGN